MENVIEEIKYRGHTIKLIQDEDAENPVRGGMDIFGNVAIWSRDYNLSSDNLDFPTTGRDAVNWARCMLTYHVEGVYGDDIEDESKVWKMFSKHFLWLPLDVSYDANGITSDDPQEHWGEKTEKWSTGWREPDGLIFISKADACKEFDAKICTQKVREKAYKLMRGEIETYDQYLSGEIVGYVVEDEQGEEIEDGSCWGFYPDAEDIQKNGFYCGPEVKYAYCIEQAKSAVDGQFDDELVPECAFAMA